MRRTVLIVEDNALAALELSYTLSQVGFAVLGEARGVAAARALLRVRLPAAALIDAHLANGENGVSLAHDLEASGVHVVLMSSDAVASWSGPFLAKPFRSEELVDLLTASPVPGPRESRMAGASFP